MSAQVFPFPAFSTLRPLVGCLTTGQVSPLTPAAGRRVTAMLPMLVDPSTPRGRVETDWLEFVLSGSSETPTGGLALRIGSAAFYLLFNLLDLSTRQMLALAHQEGCFDLLFKNAVVPLKDPSMFKTLSAFREATRDDTYPREWFAHALGLLPVLPPTCASELPAFRGAKTHHAVLLGQADALLALRAGHVGAN